MKEKTKPENLILQRKTQFMLLLSFLSPFGVTVQNEFVEDW
jgi:hypothetical protein